MKAKNVDQLTKEFSAILAEKKDAFLRMFSEDVLGIEWMVGNADLAGNWTGKGPVYKMFGGGCSISWMVGKGIKGKEYADAAGGAIMEFKRTILPELTKMYPDKPVGPLIHQDITVNEFLQHHASLWFAANNVTVRTETRLD